MCPCSALACLLMAHCRIESSKCDLDDSFTAVLIEYAYLVVSVHCCGVFCVFCFAKFSEKSLNVDHKVRTKTLETPQCIEVRFSHSIKIQFS